MALSQSNRSYQLREAPMTLLSATAGGRPILYARHHHDPRGSLISLTCLSSSFSGRKIEENEDLTGRGMYEGLMASRVLVASAAAFPSSTVGKRIYGFLGKKGEEAVDKVTEQHVGSFLDQVMQSVSITARSLTHS